MQMVFLDVLVVCMVIGDIFVDGEGVRRKGEWAVSRGDVVMSIE